MRNPTSCICEKKGADQLRAADQCVCFRDTDSKLTVLSKSEFSSFCGFTARCALDRVRNPEIGRSVA